MLPAIQPAWQPQLVLDIALETYDLPDLLAKYDLEKEYLERLYEVEQFRRELIHTRGELHANGSAFRARARALAEAHLDTMHEIMQDPETAAQTKVTIWQAFVKYASLEPPKETAVQTEAPKLIIEVKSFARTASDQAAVATATQISVSMDPPATRALPDQDWFDA